MVFLFYSASGGSWQAKPGQPVDRAWIEKIFRMDTPDFTDRLKQLFLEVNLESIRASPVLVTNEDDLAGVTVEGGKIIVGV